MCGQGNGSMRAAGWESGGPHQMQTTEVRETKAMSWLEWILLLVVSGCAAVSCEGNQAAEGLCPKESFVPLGSFVTAVEECPQHLAEHHHRFTNFS